MASLRTSARNRKPEPPVERELAIRMFEVMALMRAIEDRMVTMYRQGELLGVTPANSGRRRGRRPPHDDSRVQLRPPRVRRVTGSRFLAFIRDALQDRDWDAELG